ncbi:Yip3p [Ascoidea rubescens DSM 1968]|uniref:PRA1 family protein n=1 Tax=Ascoidea rubescens DSM 1968 TaxID=1344418 RepID=A0A1D2VHQ7_9ASCO|nr:prenylated rab acceptor 1 [Ascoidea rubescens DSM 1968]ODV61176.1 prenylated rab acceptor 1 [Ascoidea rubescens DSM 1968]
MNQISQFPFANFQDRLNVENIRSNITTVGSKLQSLKSPQEFFDFRRISKPENFGEIQSRVSYNLSYFSANYLSIIGLLSIYALVTNLLLLFVLVFFIGGVYGINRLPDGEIRSPFGTLNSSQLYTGLFMISIPLGFLASPISTMMWLIGASGVTVLGHASLMDKPIETAFESV